MTYSVATIEWDERYIKALKIKLYIKSQKS